MNHKVDWYFIKNKRWQEEIGTLRDTVLGCGLNEELKWGCPCYTLDKSNIVLIHVFKEYCAVLFFKGSLLKDPKEVLIQQTANVQAARQMRFASIKEVDKMKTTLKAYIKEAIKVEKSGAKVEFKKTTEFSMPAEFETALKQDASLKKAFYALTPGRQRGYLLYFSQAKQAKTREARIEKKYDQILKGKGLED
ncbi:MAG: YdeI family protein [Flavobacteriales bacterium]